ncbi:MAG TPA: pyridoxamine 5'-phosphate oxidase family protein [Actinomadura sp.]|nr:pyridoxamine 5'-phosphate oxidase family protein [Actinomadura sp.]
MRSQELSPTPRTRLGRARERGRLDRADLYEVLDAGMICHLGVVVEGTPRVIPTGYGRDGDTLYVHGSTGARSLRAPGGENGAAEVCVTVTHLDGVVLARSAFHHSMNYRSAMIYAVPRVLTEPAEKLTALRVISEQLAPGQWEVVRPPDRRELAATSVLALSLDEASVKVRKGPPVDEEDDHDLDVWAGVLPVRQIFGPLEPDPALRPGIPVPAHLSHWDR